MSTELNAAIAKEQVVTRLAAAVRETGQATPGTEVQIAQLIKDEFVLAVGADGLPTLQAKGAWPVTEAVKARLAGDDLSQFRGSAEAAPETEGHRLLEQAKATGRGPMGRHIPAAGAGRQGL